MQSELPVQHSTPYAFLSSLHEGHKELREDIFYLGNNIKKPIWVAEKCMPKLGDKEDKLEIVDALIEKVREAEIFLCILGTRPGERDHGTLVEVSERESNTSYLEIELYQAAMLGKPIYLFLRQGFSAGPRLQALLEILHFAIPKLNWQEPMEDKRILAEIRKILISEPDTKRFLLPWVPTTFPGRAGGCPTGPPTDPDVTD